MAAPWRNAAASTSLIDEVNQRWPDRDRASDGTIGDAAHATRSSDHNPWVVVAGRGVVRARDIDKDGIDAPWLVEHLRGLGERGDARLVGGGYLIFNGRITRPDFTGWKVYTGRNAHTAHAHVSFTRDPAGFDLVAPWGIWPLGPPPAPPDQPAATPSGFLPLAYGARRDPRLRAVQQFLARNFSYAKHLPATGNYLDQTALVVREFQHRAGITGPDADGRRIGPRTWAALVQHGYR